jgi:glycosyltransferase 2 family protein
LKSNTRKYVEFGALCILAIAILWWFGRSLNWTEVREAVARANGYLLAAAVLVVCLIYLLRALRWGALLAPIRHAKLNDLFIATTVGFAALFVFGRMGEVVRPVVLPMRDPNVRASASLVTILVERIYDLLAVVVVFGASLLWLTPPASLASEFDRVRVIGLLLLAAVLAGVFALALFRKNAARVTGWIRQHLENRAIIPARLTRAIVRLLEQLALALRVLVNARELAVTIGWTALIWFGIAVANLLVFRAFGLEFGFTETVFVTGWALVGSLVPTPGGAAGAFHAATAGALIFLGITKETAAGVSIVIHLVDFGPALAFGLIYVIRGDINLSRLRTLTSPEAVEHAVEDNDVLTEAVLAQSEMKAVTARD